jgi:hypothetical protein
MRLDRALLIKSHMIIYPSMLGFIIPIGGTNVGRIMHKSIYKELRTDLIRIRAVPIVKLATMLGKDKGTHTGVGWPHTLCTHTYGESIYHLGGPFEAIHHRIFGRRKGGIGWGNCFVLLIFRF